MSRRGEEPSPYERHTEKLLEHWRKEADLLDSRGCDHYARFLWSMAREVEAHVAGFMSAELSLTEAAAEANVAYRTMQQWVSQGQIQNQGRKGSPKVRRRDLPQYGGRIRSPGTFRPGREDSPAADAIRARRAHQAGHRG